MESVVGLGGLFPDDTTMSLFPFCSFIRLFQSWMKVLSPVGIVPQSFFEIDIFSPAERWMCGDSCLSLCWRWSELEKTSAGGLESP